MYLKGLLLEEGWQEHGLEPALFFRRDCDALTGLLITHVDDLFFAGDGAAFHEAMENLAEKVQLTYKDPPFVFCGKTVAQSEDGSIRVDQEAPVAALLPIELSTSRAKEVKESCVAEEVTELRRVIGSAAWIARQTRPDLLACTSLLAQKLGKPLVEDLLAANRLIREMNASYEFHLAFAAHPALSIVHLDQGVSLEENLMSEDDQYLREPQGTYLFVASDAAHANDADKLRS